MKLFFNPFLLLILFLFLFLFENSAYSLSNYRIKEICQKAKRRSICIKNLKSKRLNLIQGNRIEIPIIPFKRK